MTEREYSNPIDVMREIMAVPQHLRHIPKAERERLNFLALAMFDKPLAGLSIPEMEKVRDRLAQASTKLWAANAKGKELIAQYEECTGWCELVMPEVDGKPVVAQAVIRHATGCVNGRIDESERGL